MRKDNKTTATGTSSSNTAAVGAALSTLVAKVGIVNHTAKASDLKNEDQQHIEARLVELNEILRILITDNKDIKKILHSLIADYEYALILVQLKKIEKILATDLDLKNEWDKVLKFEKYKEVLDIIRKNPICNNNNSLIQQWVDNFCANHLALKIIVKDLSSSKLVLPSSGTVAIAEFKKLRAETYKLQDISNLTKGHYLTTLLSSNSQAASKTQHYNDLKAFINALKAFAKAGVPVAALCQFLQRTDSNNNSWGHLLGYPICNADINDIAHEYFALLKAFLNDYQADIRDIFKILNQLNTDQKELGRNIGYYITQHRSDGVIIDYLFLLLALKEKGLPQSEIDEHLLQGDDDCIIHNIACSNGTLIYLFITLGFSTNPKILGILKNDEAKDGVFVHLKSIKNNQEAIVALENALNKEHALGKFFLINQEILEKLGGNGILTKLRTELARRQQLASGTNPVLQDAKASASKPSTLTPLQLEMMLVHGSINKGEEGNRYIGDDSNDLNCGL